MTTVLFWVLVTAGPVLCALAGALVNHLAERSHHERMADIWWDQGYDEGWNRARLHTGTMVPDPPAFTAVQLLPAPVVPEPETMVIAGVDPLILGIRAQFDTIRMRLGLA